ncbi:Nonribosomal peptide synthetases (NRPS) [Apiospora marii]|uniref:Nonribosomal peptide synthetases (NRPS) n=1 Tax=Apiospora marii TaxID=335849 RepID=A0ABR1R6A1_9PEZI
MESPRRTRKMSPTEKMVVEAVQDLMKLDQGVTVNQDSNITALGGHSILQLRLASRLSSLTHRRLAVQKVIENPIVSHLASAIDADVVENKKAESHKQPPSHQRDGTEMLGYSRISAIEMYWFQRYRRNLGTSSFNVSHVTKLHPGFDKHQELVSAWNKVLSKHSILRSRFGESEMDGGDVRRTYALEPPKAQHAETLDVQASINTEFHLETEDPIRVTVSKEHMVICVSHIVCDYTTLNQLLKEFVATFLHKNGDGGLCLEPPRRRYQDTTCWNADIDKPTADFWKLYLSGMDHAKLSPYMKASRTSYQGESLLFKLTEDSASNLERIAGSVYLTPQQVALAIVSLVLQTDSATKQDLVLGSPYLGRQEVDMQTNGLFLQPLPIRIWRQRRPAPEEENIEGVDEGSLAAFLRGVQQSASMALGHAIEWGSLMGLLSASEDEALHSVADTPTPNHPLFDAMVTFHENHMHEANGQVLSATAAAIPGTEPLVSWTEGAKFGIMFEFSAVGTSALTLRIEYDTSLFSPDTVRLLAKRIDTGLRWIAQGPPLSRLEELEFALLDVKDAESWSDREIFYPYSWVDKYVVSVGGG